MSIHELLEYAVTRSLIDGESIDPQSIKLALDLASEIVFFELDDKEVDPTSALGVLFKRGEEIYAAQEFNDNGLFV